MTTCSGKSCLCIRVCVLLSLLVLRTDVGFDFISSRSLPCFLLMASVQIRVF